MLESLNLYCALQLRREKQHLESELERAERESATYVTEVREVSLRNTTSSVSLVNLKSCHGFSSACGKRIGSFVTIMFIVFFLF